jgi:hypothetical protein
MLGCIPAGLGESKADKKAEYKFVIVPKVADPGSTACRPGRLLSRLLRKPEPIRRRRRRARIREAENTSPHSACPSRCPLPRFSRPKNGAMKSYVDVAGSNVPAALCQRSGGDSANPCRTPVTIAVTRIRAMRIREWRSQGLQRSLLRLLFGPWLSRSRWRGCPGYKRGFC